jgi:hypothetical protein
MRKPFISGVEFSHVDFLIKGKAKIGHIDIGAVTLKKDDREYILDVTDYEIPDDTNPVITCCIEEDLITFSACKYDLTKKDLSALTEATLYVSAEYDSEPFEVEWIRLFFEIDGVYDFIELKEEQ